MGPDKACSAGDQIQWIPLSSLNYGLFCFFLSKGLIGANGTSLSTEHFAYCVARRCCTATIKDVAKELDLD
jgi:hypothetical protein